MKISTMARYMSDETRSHLYKDNGLIVHQVYLPKEVIRPFYVMAFYMPNEMKAFWKRTVESNRLYGYQISTFREQITSEFSDVYCINFSEQALCGEEPFLIMDPEVNDICSILVYARFTAFLKEKLMKVAGSEEIPNFDSFSECTSQKLSVAELMDYEHYKMYLGAWFAKQFGRHAYDAASSAGLDRRVFEREGKGEKAGEIVESHMFVMPRKWYSSTYDTEPIVISEVQYIEDPKKPKKNNPMKRERYAYRLNMKFDKEESGEVSLSVYFSGPRWVNDLKMNGDWYYPQKENGKGTMNRSLFIVNEDVQTMTRLTTSLYKGKVHVNYRQDVEPYWERLGNPSVEEILSTLHEKDDFLVPYLEYDKKNYNNNVNSGISGNEQHQLFQVFMETFPFLLPACVEYSVVKHPRLKETLPGGKVYLADGSVRKREDIFLEVVSETSDLYQRVREALLSLDKGRMKLNGKCDSFETIQEISVDEKESVFEFKNDGEGESVRLIVQHQPAYAALTDDLGIEADKATEEKIRVDACKELWGICKQPTLSLISIKSYGKRYGGKADPYEALKKAGIETNRITQMIHEEEKNTEQRLLSCLRDLLSTKGFANQRILLLKEEQDERTYYFPRWRKVRLANGKEGYVPVLIRQKQAEVSVRFFHSKEWLPFDWAAVEGKSAIKPSMLVESEAACLSFIMEHADHEQSVLVFLKQDIPDLLEKRAKMGRLTCAIAILHQHEYVPFITQRKKGKVSQGKYVIRASEGVYICCPPKPAQITMNQSVVKQEVNNKLATVRPLKIQVINSNDAEDIAISLHMSRGVALTYNEFLSLPLPLHLFRKHIGKHLSDFKPIKQF